MSARMDSHSEALIYSDGMQHISDELSKLDLIIKRRLLAFRSELDNGQGNAATQHMFIAHDEIDWLLQDSDVDNGDAQQIEVLERDILHREGLIAETLLHSQQQGVDLPLLRLARLFNLSEFEIQVLIICLAPELRRKYDRIYAYLQDDITRKRPSIDLVLHLLCANEIDRWRLQSLFTNNGVLLQAGLLHIVEDPQSPSGCSSLGRLLKLDPGILSYTLGRHSIDPRLGNVLRIRSSEQASERLISDATISRDLAELIDWRFGELAIDSQKLVVYLHGPAGVGKRALALQQCERLQCDLLHLDAIRLLGSETDIEAGLRLAFREAMLLQTPLYIESIDVLVNDETRGPWFARMISKLVEEYGWLSFFAGESSWHAQPLFEKAIFKSVSIPMPDFSLRKRTWIHSLQANGDEADESVATQLASQFQLTPGQIHAASDAVRLQRHLTPDADINSGHQLLGACRDQSNQRLRELATKIDPVYHWEDLILPERAQGLLQQICDQIRQQYKVFNLWGFDRKLSYGKGLSALFTGPPGTGKTMAAQVIANEIQLDLYKVDLSTVISKYIGETEKNLSRIFKEAETSNAILFFDEADALFGKRTEVNDAHDRYANIEVSYLLQKMEEYNGIVILASNFRVNMDDAFVRRIRFIIEFPFPDEASRLQIWKIHFPQQAPLADDIDYPHLARQFSIPGGNIKNVILNAAFQAAKLDVPIAMAHILEGTRHEYEKIGKLWSDGSAATTTSKRSRR